MGGSEGRGSNERRLLASIPVTEKAAAAKMLSHRTSSPYFSFPSRTLAVSLLCVSAVSGTEEEGRPLAISLIPEKELRVESCVPSLSLSLCTVVQHSSDSGLPSFANIPRSSQFSSGRSARDKTCIECTYLQLQYVCVV